MSALDSHGTVKHVSNNHNKCFPSNVMGQRIVNAVTGKKYDFCVGSKESLSLFKVIDTSGTYDKSGKKRRSSDVDKIVHSDPNHFYFDGPQEYAQHRRYHHNHITSDLPIPICLDQPFIVYHAVKNNLYDNQKLINIVINNPNNFNNETISHFPGGPGHYESKIVKMSNYMRNIMYMVYQRVQVLVRL